VGTIDDLDSHEAVVNSPTLIRNLKGFTTGARLCMSVFHPLAGGASSFGEHPLIAKAVTARTRSIQCGFLTGPQESVGAGHSDEFAWMLSQIGLPEKGISFLDPPERGRIWA